MRLKLISLAGLLLATSAFSISAFQDMPKPGPEHAVLKDSEGSWEATIKSQGSESKGTSTNKMVLGGLWLMEDFKGDFGGMAFEGHGMSTYDASKKKYVMVWVDSMSTSPMVVEGTYDAKTKTMTMAGDMPMPGAGTMKATMTTVFNDANTRTFTLKAAGPDGKDMELMQIVYKRKAQK